MRDPRNIYSYIITILILVVLFFWIDKSSLRLLLNTNILSILMSLFLAIVTYLFSGIELYFIRKQFGVSLRLKDIFLLPIVGNLWSFIFPFQGNLLFTTLFFKQKYNMLVSESFSISIYLYLVTLCYAGLFGLIFAAFNSMLFSWLSLFSLLFLLNPLFIYLINAFLKNIGQSPYKWVRETQVFLASVVDNTEKLWLDLHFTITILIINVARILLSIVWYYWISYSLDLDMSFVAVALISLLMSISVIIKITPENLGIAQLVIGGFMSLIGVQPEKAILITLFASATTMLLIFTVGLYGNFHYFKTINFHTLFKMNKDM
jgi:uncharacterized membrane protein YbhN (UPF0104 family)